MPVVDMKDMLEHAWQHHYAVGAFDVINLDFVSGMIAAAAGPMRCWPIAHPGFRWNT